MTEADEAFEVDVVETETAFSGRVWDVRVDRFRYGDGELVRQVVQHPGAVAIVAIDDDGRVLLIQQYRHPIGTRDWEIPAGLLDVEGEEPLQAARRELAEETDLTAERWEPLMSQHPTPGGSSEVIHIFLATGLAPAPQRHERGEEEADIRTAWLPLEDAVRAVTGGRMHNGTLALGVLLAAERMRAAEAG